MNKVIHVDMDAFFAAIEQRDFPELRGKAVIVGGNPDKRGVVATCSYEARKFGVQSAMPVQKAYRLCPHAKFVNACFDVYSAVSIQIREIFFRYSDLVEPLSLDEAYLDVTVNKKNEPSASLLAKEILKEIYKVTGLTASAGVSYNKFLAKVASDINKPNGLTVISPIESERFIESLPIRKFYGVGECMEKKLILMGACDGKSLKTFSLEQLTSKFGKMGAYLFDIARGVDKRLVTSFRERKSISKETTFVKDISDPEELKATLKKQAQILESIFLKKKIRGRRVTLKLRYADFTTFSRSMTSLYSMDSWEMIFDHALCLLGKFDLKGRYIRLIGLGISKFPHIRNAKEDRQLEFDFG